MTRKAALALCMLAALAVLVSIPASAQLAQSSWPKYQGDVGNTGHTSVVAAGHTLQWSRQTDGWSSIYDGVSVGADGTIYAPGVSGVRAISPGGTTLWVHNTGLGSYTTPAVGRDGTIYYSAYTSSSMLYAINPNGTQKWSYALPGSSRDSRTTIDAQGNLYIISLNTPNTPNQYVYSFNASTGALNWQKPIGTGSVSPAVDGLGRILIAGDRYVWAFNTAGAITWYGWAGTFASSTVAVGPDNTFYLGTDTPGSYNNYLLAYNPDGSLKWYNNSIPTGINGAPAVAPDGSVYAISEDGYLRGFSPTGVQRWAYRSSTYPNVQWDASPIIDGAGTIYYSGEAASGGAAALIAMNPNGTLKWTADLQGDASPLAIGAQGQIYANGTYVKCFVPEPSALLVVLTGTLALALRRRRG